MTSGLVSKAVRALELNSCPICIHSALLIQVAPPQLACAGGCPPERVRQGVREVAQSITGSSMYPAKQALLELVDSLERSVTAEGKDILPSPVATSSVGQTTAAATTARSLRVNIGSSRMR